MAVNFYNLVIAFFGTALLSFIFSRLVMMVASRLKILDYPTADRKIHQTPTPLLGGLAIYLAWALIILWFYFNHQLLDGRLSWPLVAWVLLAGLVLIINGVLDDKFNLPAKITIFGPIMASALAIYGGVAISHVTNPSGGILYLDQMFGLGLPMIITFFWLLGITYTTKLLDGIDGLTSSIGLVASLVIFIVSLSWDVSGSTTSLLAVILAGAIFGFWLLNWHPAKIFLGEGGSTFIGFSLGVLAIISGSKIATALLVMGLPVLDIFWVIVRRLRRGQHFWRGDREHLHFRLLAAGLSQRQVVFFLSFISLCFGLISIFFTTKTKLGALAALFIFMFILSSWLNYKLKKVKKEIYD